jgi:hypothetical protein
VPLLEALESILKRISLTFIADSEQIRIVTLDEGLEFWKGWEKREEEKRK